MNVNDVQLVATVEQLTWQQAEQAARSGDLLLAAAHYLACPPLAGRGGAPAHFHVACCYERAGRLLEAGELYKNSVSQSSDAAMQSISAERARVPRAAAARPQPAPAPLLQPSGGMAAQ